MTCNFNRIDGSPFDQLGDITLIRSQQDFGIPVAGVITVTDGTYFLVNDVTLDDGVRLVIDPVSNANATLCAVSPDTKLIGNIAALPLVEMPNQGYVCNIALRNEATGAIDFQGSSRTDPELSPRADFIQLSNVIFESPTDFSQADTLIRVLGDNAGRFRPRLLMELCSAGLFADFGIVVTDGEVQFLSMVGCIFGTPTGIGLLMDSTFAGFGFGATIVAGNLTGNVAPAPAFPCISLAAGGVILSATAPFLFSVSAVNLLGVLDGFTSADPDVLFRGNSSVADSLHLGAGGFSGNATATVMTVIGQFETINDGGNFVDGPVTQRFTLIGVTYRYDGVTTRNARVSWQMALMAVGGTTPLFQTRLEVNGVPVADSTITMEGTNRQQVLAMSTDIPADPGDIFEITIANIETTVDVIVGDYSFDVQAT